MIGWSSDGEVVDRLPDGMVLVGLDFDGTISHIAERPEEATAVPGAIDALTALAALDDVEVAVVSGRRLNDLHLLLGRPSGVRLIGEHGAAWEGVDIDRPIGLDDLGDRLTAIAARHPGAWVEVKTTSICLHTRAVSLEREPFVIDEVLTHLTALGDPAVRWGVGKRVIDVTFAGTSKGLAVEHLRDELAIDAVIFLGDDTTDETVFERLGATDLGVKVGPGISAATHRIPGPEDVVGLLNRLVMSGH